MDKFTADLRQLENLKVDLFTSRRVPAAPRRSESRHAFEWGEAGHGYCAPLISMMLRSGSRMKSWGKPAGPSRRTMTLR